MNEEYSTQATDTQSTATMSSSSQLGSLGMPGSCNRRVGLFTEAQAKSVARYLRLLEIIYAAIASDTVITKRDIFYRDVTLFGGQNYIDRTASSKGLVCGPITITLKNGKRINCKYSKKSNSGHEDHQGCLVPSFSQITKIELNAKFVIVVEKEATFRDLISVNRKHTLLKHCIFITGRGYPDISTRHIVKHISVNFTGIPIMALMDNDPHGLEIYSVYRWGSLSQAFDTANLAVPEIHLIGLNCRDRQRFDIPLSAYQPLTKADRDKARGIITMREKFFGSPKGFWSDECPQRNSKSYKEFIKELCAILHINMKCELQGLCVAGGPFAMPRYVEKCLEKFKTS
ncbi:Spo11/DNA topoisomerase VI subunit A [Phycomyces blakesleeanus]|uniref:DNA topoisomerase (ATP-hydrolyzing) n=1 Tax=Phycomyces blakesleeanus TaxID=4837 RepID=A0ABR3AMS5_PHYBL